jgi:hypothetical protein
MPYVIISPMTIAELWGKCKNRANTVPKDAYLIGVLALACILSFGLGYRAGLDAKTPSDVTIEASGIENAGKVFASKNGTKYYYPDCESASRVVDANKVWFTSASAAALAGYTAAAGCEGE